MIVVAGFTHVQPKKLLYVMRSCDYDEEVTAKGLQVAAQMLQVSTAKQEV